MMHLFSEEDLRLFARAWVEVYIESEDTGWWEEKMFDQLMVVFEKRFKEQESAKGTV